MHTAHSVHNTPKVQKLQFFVPYLPLNGTIANM